MRILRLTLALMAAAAVLLWLDQAIGAPGQLRKNIIEFVWDEPRPDQQIEAYNLYVRTNLPAGFTLPAPKGVIPWVPPQTQASEWKLHATIPAPATSIRVTNIWTQLGTSAFFTLTASNSIGESDFSNAAWIPAPPSSSGLQIREVQ